MASRTDTGNARAAFAILSVLAIVLCVLARGCAEASAPAVPAAGGAR